jgi:tRNA (guanine10-N2)-dimethyltransferase
MGIHAIGIDFDENMCKISRQNLEANGFSSEVINADYKELQRFQNKIDGIVTDLPYGRASKSSQDPEKLVRNFIEILPRKKKFAIMCKKGFEDKLNISLSKRYEIYRHKSLTRIVLVK